LHFVEVLQWRVLLLRYLWGFCLELDVSLLLSIFPNRPGMILVLVLLDLAAVGSVSLVEIEVALGGLGLWSGIVVQTMLCGQFS
jgi:hypothetical protein